MQQEQIALLAQEQLAGMVEIRRHLHRHPEISFEERETAGYIARQLQQCGVACQTGTGGVYGITAHFRFSRPGPHIAFRADFDALPITEATGAAYASKNPGAMHACGHDAHTSALLGLARVLAGHPEYFSGQATLVFQPAEELPPGGALPMIQAGCLEGVDAIYAMHVDDSLDAGSVGAYAGPYMAATDTFTVQVSGDGGHGSRPHEASDVISAACACVGALNTIVSRRVPANDAAVVSVCSIHAGTTYNILPATAAFGGTVRTYDDALSGKIQGEVRRCVKGVCESYGVGCSIDYTRGYPVVVNDDGCTQQVHRAVQAQGLRLEPIRPTAVGEDFSYYLQKVPGCMFRVGVRNPGKGAAFPLHHDRFDLDESAMAVALQVFLSLLCDG